MPIVHIQVLQLNSVTAKTAVLHILAVILPFVVIMLPAQLVTLTVYGVFSLTHPAHISSIYMAVRWAVRIQVLNNMHCLYAVLNN